MKNPRNIVDHPSHYNGHPSKIECADLILATNALLGLAIKHVWRCGEKHDSTCPFYARELYDRLRMRCTPDETPIIAAAFEDNLPCAHCAKVDRKKAAWYMRRLAKWLADEHCHAVPHGLHASLEMAKSIFEVTPEGHPLRVVLVAAWGDECDGFDDSEGWHARYARRCVGAAEVLEDPFGREVVGSCVK